MSQAYTIVAGLDEFSAAREHYASMVKHLQSQEMGELEHGAVEEYLWKAAYCFHGSGTEAAERWVGERALRLSVPDEYSPKVPK